MGKAIDKLILQLNNKDALLELLNDEKFSVRIKECIVSRMIENSLDNLWRSEGRYDLEEHIEKFLNKRYDMETLLADWCKKSGTSDCSKRVTGLKKTLSDQIDVAMEDYVKTSRFAAMVKDTMSRYTKSYMASKVRNLLDSPEFEKQIRDRATSVLLNKIG